MVAQDDNLTSMNSSGNVTDDREARSKFWIAAYTRPRSEKKAAAEIAKFGIETFVPVQKQLRIWSDRKKLVDVPVIPMIIFAQITEEEIKLIREHSLIIRIISQLDRKTPAHIPKEQIDNLKYILGQSEIPAAFEEGYFRSDDLVTISSGSLIGLIGQVKSVNKNMTEVWVAINLLGGTVIKVKSSELIHTNLLKH